MSEKKKFLLRLDSTLFAALQHWAADDLRSVNAQIEFLLTDAVRKARRGGAKEPQGRADQRQADSGPAGG
jgi:hypothetical protein